jgi:hypothetical protein
MREEYVLVFRRIPKRPRRRGPGPQQTAWRAPATSGRKGQCSYRRCP